MAGVSSGYAGFCQDGRAVTEAVTTDRDTGVLCWACGNEATPFPEYGFDELSRCRKCGLVFQPGRVPSELRELYDRAYFETYDLSATEAKVDRSFEADVRVHFVRGYQREGRLLEIGAGAGYFLAAAARAGFTAQGIEASSEMAEAGRSRFGVDILFGTIEEAELESASFDVACAWHVIEHIADPLPSLSRVRRALGPGGWIFVEVPNFASVRSGRKGAAWPTLHLHHHVGQYTPTALAALLDRAGFDDISTVTVPFAVYKRPARALLSYAKHGLLLRSWPVGPHPVKHELLRAVARAPRR